MLEPIVLLLVTCFFMGTAVGWFAGLLGIGGGLIIVPTLSSLLVYWLNFDIDIAMPVAVATSLSTIIFTGMSSARAHYKLGNINHRIVIYAGIGIALGALLGVKIATALSGKILALVFASLVLLIAFNMAFGKVIERQGKTSKRLLGSIGIFSGTLSALMGIGGGAILVPLLCWFGTPLRKAIGCAAAGGIIIAIFSTSGFILMPISNDDFSGYFIGYVFWPATLAISLTSVLFAPKGARFGHKLNTEKLKKVFAGFLVLVSFRMFWGLI